MNAAGFYAGLALALCLPLTRTAHAAGDDDAEASFTSALAAYDRAEYEDALRSFQRAYALKPSYKLLYNIGLTQMARGDAAHALDAFEQYLREGGDKIPSARRSELKGTQASLVRKVGELVIDAPQADASYTLDGEALSAARVQGAIRANPGEHWLCRSNPPGEGEPTCRVALVLAEKRTTMRMARAAAPQPSATPLPVNEQPADAPAERTRDNTWRWVTWSGAGVLAASGALTGLLALNARSSEKDAEQTRDITRSELDAAHSKTQNLALATDLLLAGAAVCTGVALYLQLSSPHDESGAQQSSARVQLRPTGVDVALRF